MFNYENMKSLKNKKADLLSRIERSKSIYYSDELREELKIVEDLIIKEARKMK